MRAIYNEFIINQNIDYVFENIFNNDLNGMDDLFDIVNIYLGKWYKKKDKKYKKDEYYLYIETLPDEYGKYTLEGSKFVRFIVKNELNEDLKKFKIIKSKYILTNINPLINTIINKFELLKVRMITELKELNTDITCVKITIFVTIYLPKSKLLETFLINMCNNIVNNLKCKLNKTI